MQGSGVLVPAPSSPKLLGSGSRGGPLRTLEGVGHRHARAGTWRLPRRDPGWAEVAVQGNEGPCHGSMALLQTSPAHHRGSAPESRGTCSGAGAMATPARTARAPAPPPCLPLSRRSSASELLIVRPRLAGSAQFPDASVVLGRPEEGVRSPGAGVIGICERLV